jgi:hypothetical protein
MIGLLLGTSRLVVGVEPDPVGRRVFLDARWKGQYVLVDHPEAIREIDQAWARGGHVTMSTEDGRWPRTITSYDTMALRRRR